MHNLTKDGEFRYIIQWFNEWSELQRDDFIPVLVEYLTAAHNLTDATGSNAVYMNGLVHAVSQSGIHERPMSLFQCRIKLFREWSVKWPQDFKLKLQQKITEIDTKVGERIINDLKTSNETATVHFNGIAAHDDGDCEDVTNAVMRAAQSIFAATEAAIQTDVRLIAESILPTAAATTTMPSTTTPVVLALTVDNNDEVYNNDDDINGVVDGDDIVNDNSDLAAATTTTITAVTDSLITTMRGEPAEPVELPTQEHVATTTLATAIPI